MVRYTSRVRLAALALVFLPACFFGCSKVEGKIEALKGFTLPKDQDFRTLKLKNSSMKPVRELVSCGEEAVDPTLKQMGVVVNSDACGYILALGYLKTSKAVSPLIDILKKEEGAVGTCAAFALVKLRKQGSLKKVAVLVKEMADLPAPVRLNIYRVFAWGHDSDQYKHLAQGLSDSEESVKTEVLGMMKTLRHPSLALPLLKVLALGGESSVAAGKALFNNVDSLKDRDILPLAASKMEEVREAAIGLLAVIDSPAGLKALVQGLDDPSARVRVASAEALGSIKKATPAKETKEKIARMLDTEDAELSRKIHDVLIAMNARDAREVLIGLLDSPRVHVGRFASSLLVQCAPFRQVSPKTDLTECKEIPKLIELLSSSDKDTVLNAANTLHIYTSQIFEDNQAKWKKWWKNHCALMVYIGKAQKLVKQVEAWNKEESLAEHKKEAIAALEEAMSLYEEVEEKKLCSMNFETECSKIIRLLRVARSTGAMDD